MFIDRKHVNQEKSVFPDVLREIKRESGWEVTLDEESAAWKTIIAIISFFESLRTTTG